MRKSILKLTIAAALAVPFGVANAVIATNHAPVCLAGVLKPGQTLTADLINAVNNGGVAGLPAAVASLIRGGADPALVVQAAVAYGGNPQAVVNAAMSTGVPKDWTVVRIAAIACGADPTTITEPAAFGGLAFPGTTPVPQSQGGDPVSPS